MKLELIREKNNFLPNITNPEKYKEIKIWHCNYKSLEQLSHFLNIEILTIATYPNNNLNILSPLIKLKKLQIIHLPKITSLEPLKNLINLEDLELSTLPSWDPSGKMTIVDSLMPLSNLYKLKTFILGGVIPKDKLLEPLLKCNKLKRIQTGNYFSIEQLTKLLKHKKYEGTFFKPFIELPFGACNKCHSKKVMLSGASGRKIFCPVCNKKKVDEHLYLWNSLLEK